MWLGEEGQDIFFVDIDIMCASLILKFGLFSRIHILSFPLTPTCTRIQRNQQLPIDRASTGCAKAVP